VNQYHVVLEVAPEFQRGPDSLKDIYVHSSTGADVPLSAFTTLERTSTPLTVSHKGNFPAVTISFNLAPGNSLGKAVKSYQQAEQEIGMTASIHSSFQGTAAAFQSSLSNEVWLILAALVTAVHRARRVVRKLIHPITILSTLLPPEWSAAGAADLPDGPRVVGLIGIVLLIGIVKKNAINDDRLRARRRTHEGKSPEESIYQACLLRFRPIMMTTMAALFAGLPLALGRGTGSELRHPLASPSSADYW